MTFAVYSIKTEHLSESENETQPKKMAQLSPKKIDGIGPTTREGMPLTLRSVSFTISSIR
jgi:hypothetical protein